MDTSNIGAYREFVELVAAIGPAFHPDTRGGDYLNLPDGYDAMRVEEIVTAAFDANTFDPYLVALNVLEVGA